MSKYLVLKNSVVAFLTNVHLCVCHSTAHVLEPLIVLHMRVSENRLSPERVLAWLFH